MDLLLVAVTALLAATLSAIAGFSGGSLLLPVLVAVFGVHDAVPMLAVAQVIGNGARAWLNRRQVHSPVVGWFLLGAVPMALLGGWLFSRAPAPYLTRLLGLVLIASVAARHLKLVPDEGFPVHRFAFVGGGFSFLSALAGTVGPILIPFFLAFGLVKGALVGTEAAATGIMHVARLTGYAAGGALGNRQVALGLALGPLMVAGSLLGKGLLDRLPERVFIVAVEALLVAMGLYLLVRS